MKIYAKNDYIIGKPYKSNENNGLIITNKNDDNIVEIISYSTYGVGIKTGDVIVYNKDKAIELYIDGVTYIAFKFEDVVACIERGINNG